MPFESVEVVLADGQHFGPIDWASAKSWVVQNRIGPTAMLIDSATREERPVSEFPELTLLLAQQGSDPVSYVIPYNNKPALIAYYLGIFSLAACIPVLGILGVVMGVAALILGLKGLKLAAANPQAHGRVHAWIGVICGPICALVGLVLNIAFIVALLTS